MNDKEKVAALREALMEHLPPIPDKIQGACHAGHWGGQASCENCKRIIRGHKVLAAAATAQSEASEGRSPYPKYWKGDKVEVVNEHGHFYKAVINRPETRWSAEREPFVGYMVAMPDGSIHRVVESNIRCTLQSAKGESDEQ